jgi:group I intron endonuclease
MEKTYYTIYKITNQINGKIYIGSHKTKNLNDNYMGSGKYLNYAQDKYGIEKFKKEILFVFDTAQEMYAKEAELVNVEFLAEHNTYNIKVGGFGGFDYINTSMTKEQRHDICSAGGKASSGFTGKRHSEEHIRNLIKIREQSVGPFAGKTHTNETKQRMSDAAKQRSADSTRNTQYGTRWIYSEELKVSRKINKYDVTPAGWIDGRKIKWVDT